MTAEIRVWRIQKGSHLNPVKSCKLDMGARLEDWIEKEISILSDDLLVIGRQVETEYGGAIDLLCLDGQGDVVIVELKRDKSPREVTAQILDYATWVKDMCSRGVGQGQKKRSMLVLTVTSELTRKSSVSWQVCRSTRHRVSDGLSSWLWLKFAKRNTDHASRGAIHVRHSLRHRRLACTHRRGLHVR